MLRFKLRNLLCDCITSDEHQLEINQSAFYPFSASTFIRYNKFSFSKALSIDKEKASRATSARRTSVG